MQAPASPRRPTRRRQRTRLSAAAISLTASAVPSGELSSTKIASQAMPAKGEVQPPHQFGDIAPLLVGGHDNGKLGAAHLTNPGQGVP